jgi:acyl carrier protein
MDRSRVRDEVIEILANKLHKLPQLPVDPEVDEDPFDYENQVLVPDITDNHLDIAEVAMDLEDAFGFNFDDQLPGGEGLETVGKLVDLIHSRVIAPRRKVGSES